MRALLVGVGGAGCRIVEKLNSHDVRSGVRSVRSYVFDADMELVNGMTKLDADKRIVLSPLNPADEHLHGTDFDISNLAYCFQDSCVDEIDGVFVCAGLGGRMAELVPGFVEQLAAAFPDPVFTILTLPGRSEGVKISARAADELAAIRGVCSASIVFDNETWLARLEAEREEELAKKNKDKEGEPEEMKRVAVPGIAEFYDELNEILARRVGLLLRAGEFTHNGIESAEVVLDAGEVLNTLTGMDVVSIGYAIEKLPSNFSGILKKFRVEKYLLDEGHKRTARIVELAKRAVYEEVSVPCDLTSANKALILIAGPSNELSMKGFQTVRKWIDKSIRGMEMRAGDYPVKSTKYVGVIVVLAGIENVPRIEELNEISVSYDEELSKEYDTGEDFCEVDVPLLSVASDDTIFEPGMLLPAECGVLESEAGGERGLVPMMSTYDADDEQYSDEDFFEDEPVAVKRKAPAQRQAAAVPVEEPLMYEPAMPQERVRVPEPKRRERDPQISLGGAKKKEVKKAEDIALPKRERKADGVLTGMASVGGHDMPKDAERGVRMAGSQRPKETDGHVRMAAGSAKKVKEI
ncbi:MAG: tubulin/FtsZ family protein, partial [Methanocorpusculum sp.]|nr:tubulin/FtsZ family protein [Methanocorpusculum sp.]